MTRKALLKLGVAAALLATASACASSTMIISTPPGAKLYLDGEYVGQTPYTMTDTKVVGSTTTVRLEYPGYQPYYAAISRNEQFDVGACIGGLLVLVPFLWIQDYKPTHSYELQSYNPQYRGYPPPGYAPPGGYPPGYSQPRYPPPPPGGYPPPPQSSRAPSHHVAVVGSSHRS